MMTADSKHPFRFGVVAPITSGPDDWKDRLRRIAGLGYSTVLLPDVPGWQPEPAPTLAIASTVTDMRVGTWVLASPLRPAWAVASEAHALTQLTDGRFDLGLGTGRPDIAEIVRDLGLPPTSREASADRLRDIVQRLRELDGPDVRTPVAMAVRGARMRAFAAEVADIVTFSITPADSRGAVEEWAAGVRAIRDVVLALHVSVVGDVVAPFMTGPDTDPAQVRAADSMSFLPDDPAAAVDELHRRREECGFSYVVIGSNAADILAPVVAELDGQ